MHVSETWDWVLRSGSIAVVSALLCAQNVVVGRTQRARPLGRGAVATANLWRRPLGSGGRRQGRERWQLDVHRGDDGSIGGRVTLAGSPLASAGNVQGQIEGRRVWGSIVDDQGALIADFTGMVTATGLTGSYRDRTGETGRWAWDGSLE